MEKWVELNLQKAREMESVDFLIETCDCLLRLFDAKSPQLQDRKRTVEGHKRALATLATLYCSPGTVDSQIKKSREEIRIKLRGQIDFAEGYYGSPSSSGNTTVTQIANSIVNIGSRKVVDFGDDDRGLEEEKPKMTHSDAQARMEGMRESMLKVRLYSIASLTNEGDKLFTKLLKRFGAWAVSADAEDFSDICDEIDKFRTKVRVAVDQLEKGWKDDIERRIRNSSDYDVLTAAIDILRTHNPDGVTSQLERLTPSSPINVRLAVRRELYRCIGKMAPN